MPEKPLTTPNPSDAPPLSRRVALSAPLMLAAPPVTAEGNPDAVLLRICAEHRQARDLLNAAKGEQLVEDSPLEQRYIAALHAMQEAHAPTTIEGVLALAAAAFAEAEGHRWDDIAGEWAGTALTALLKLRGVTQ